MPTRTVTRAEPVASARIDRHIPGEAGLWILLFGDLTVFAVLFVVYLQHRGQYPALFASSQATLNPALGAINTLVLLSSSLLVVLATRALRGRWRRYAPRLILGAIALGMTFIGIKAAEYHDLLGAGISPHTNSFYMYYFVLTGLHLAHLLIGLAVLSVLFSLSRRSELTTGQFMFFEGGACFWHMVDLLWILIFPLVFLVR